MDQRTTIAVYITNVMTGGTYRHAKELVNTWRKEGKRVIFIKVVYRITEITIYEADSKKTIFLYGEDKTADIAKILQYYQTTILHVEHLFDAPLKAFYLHQLAECRLVVTLHDYYSICPFIKLIDKTGCYCGESGCEQELKKRKFYSLTFKKNITDIGEWRHFWQSYLKQADLIMVPSVDMQQRMKQYFPEFSIKMVENPELVPYRSHMRRVGLIGILPVSKGAQKIKEALSYCVKHGTEIHFVLFGRLLEVDLTEQEKKYIDILGPYQEQEVYQQIRQQAIDFFWFPGVWPETYSYTLSIPVRLHIPCISTDLGAIAMRIKSNHWGRTYSWKADAETIIHELIKFQFESYYNRDFQIRNTTFGSFESYYGVVATQSNRISKNEVYIDVDKLTIERVLGDIKESLRFPESSILWENANNTQKIQIIRHLDFKYYLCIMRAIGLEKTIDKMLERMRSIFK